MIDTSIRKRWGLAPTSTVSLEDGDVPFDQDTVTTSSNVDFRNRFRVSAQEWLSTWRIIE